MNWPSIQQFIEFTQILFYQQAKKLYNFFSNLAKFSYIPLVTARQNWPDHVNMDHNLYQNSAFVSVQTWQIHITICFL